MSVRWCAAGWIKGVFVIFFFKKRVSVQTAFDRFPPEFSWGQGSYWTAVRCNNSRVMLRPCVGALDGLFLVQTWWFDRVCTCECECVSVCARMFSPDKQINNTCLSGACLAAALNPVRRIIFAPFYPQIQTSAHMHVWLSVVGQHLCTV